MNARSDLLDEIGTLQDDGIHFIGLGLKPLLIVFTALIVVLALGIPKIYLSNNIYYKSRNIQKLQTELDALREENKILKRSLEDIKFKYLTTEIDF